MAVAKKQGFTSDKQTAGLAVDAQGQPVVDPTANVLALVGAAVQRLNDLADAEQRRQDELRQAESRRVDEQAALREFYGTQLREAEAKRIDAIRAVDVNAVQVASERAAAQASVLASQLAQSTEASRTLVAASAAAVAAQFTQTITPITDRLALLEKALYEGQGKSGVTDPMFGQLLTEIKGLRESQAVSVGRQIFADPELAQLRADVKALRDQLNARE